MNKKIAIVTDSSSAITKKEANKYNNLRVIPLIMVVDNTISFEDTPANVKKYKLSIAIENMVSKTSQINPSVLQKTFDELLKDYEGVFYLPVSYGLSGQYNTAAPLMEMDKYKDKLYVYHNNNNDFLLKLLVFKLADMAAKKAVSFEQLKQIANETDLNNYTACSPGNLSQIIASGHVRTLTALVAKVVNVFKIIALVEWGEKAHKKFFRTMRKTASYFISVYQNFIKEHGNNYKIVISACSASKGRRLSILKQCFEEQQIPYLIEEIATVYPAHGGLETLGFFIISQKLLKYGSQGSNK